MDKDIAIILLAGGIGSRMKMATPKQFLTINDKPIAHYSFEILITLPNVAQVVVVAAREYHHLFKTSVKDVKLSYALPGIRRQDSLYNGLQKCSASVDYICIHDAARPCVTKEVIQQTIKAAREHGAAAVGVPLKFTVKQCNADQMVLNTPDRSSLWEIQSPQVVRQDLLQRGFEMVNRLNATVTDDVSLIEHLNHPVKIVEGSSTNLKITTPEDLAFAEYLLKNDPF